MKKIVISLSVAILLLLPLGLGSSEAGWDLIHSNTEYQKNLKIEALLVNKSQVESYLREEKVEQLPHKELSAGNLNLILSLLNTGDLASWGVLEVSINSRKSYEINIHSLPANMTESYVYIVPISGLIVSKGEKDYLPQITTKWKKVYAK